MATGKCRVSVSLDAETAKGLRRAADCAGIESLARAAALVLARVVCGGAPASGAEAPHSNATGADEVEEIFGELVPASAECSPVSPFGPSRGRRRRVPEP